MRIPEKWFPGVVDFYLNSHNIMHVLVVVAVYSMHKVSPSKIVYLPLLILAIYFLLGHHQGLRVDVYPNLPHGRQRHGAGPRPCGTMTRLLAAALGAATLALDASSPSENAVRACHPRLDRPPYLASPKGGWGWGWGCATTPTRSRASACATTPQPRRRVKLSRAHGRPLTSSRTV